MDAVPNVSIRSLFAGLRSQFETINADLSRLEALVLPAKPDGEEAFDPKDPRNKYADGTLTPRGEEVCYRLFDAGLNRNQVRKAMNIAHGAATSRMIKWQKLGGPNRVRRPLDQAA